MADITRMHTGVRSSKIVIHGDTIYLTGQVGNPEEDITEQTRTCLQKIDELLAEAGSDKTRILQTTIWLADMADFAALNEVWNAWVPEGHAPARACGEAKLARPQLKVEFIVTAAR
jgi:enamine deaminase RidA (YjgF/YER057c/UK114 family)